MERLWKVTLNYRDHTKSQHDIIAVTFDEAIQEAIRISGRKPVWASETTHQSQ